MRGSDGQTGSMFSYVDLEERVPAGIRCARSASCQCRAGGARRRVRRALSADGRPSIAPERLLRAALIQILFSIRSERQLMEQMQYNLLFRWFVGLGIDDPVWVPTVFTKNRDRLLNTDIARKFLAAILAHKEVAPLLSDEHFSVDGTLIEAWASMKSFQPKAGADGSEPPAAGAGGTGASVAKRRLAKHADACGGQGPQCRSEFSRPEAVERNACLRHRSRCPPLPQGRGQGGEALLHGACADGEPQRPRGRSLPHARGRSGRAERGAGDDRASRGPVRPHHARRRQGLRRRRLRQRAAIHERDAARGGESQGLGHRRPHHAACRLRSQPAHPQADRGAVRLGQDGRADQPRPCCAAWNA